MSGREVECKDCRAEGTTSFRPAPHPGKRCTTHHRHERRRQKAAAHARYLERTYKMPAGGYERLLAHQGGACFMCRRAKGISKRLAVDHDHRCCPETPTCGKCTRGLLCTTCNKLLGHGRDDPQFFIRAAVYLQDPPARQLGLG